MPNKLKTKLKQQEFYCVKCRKRCKSTKNDICIVEFKNGSNAMEGQCSKCDCMMYKFIKDKDVDKLIDKFGEC